ncbi:hypothetical protein Tco_0211535 [Tanacetum coccineum]
MTMSSRATLHARGPVAEAARQAPPLPTMCWPGELSRHTLTDYVIQMRMRIDMYIDEEDEGSMRWLTRGGGGEHQLCLPVVVALPATAPSAEETEPFETDESAATPPPHPAYRMTARISIPEPYLYFDSPPLPPPFHTLPHLDRCTTTLPNQVTSFPPLSLPMTVIEGPAGGLRADYGFVATYGQVGLDVTLRGTLDMGLQIHGMRSLRLYRELRLSNDTAHGDECWPVREAWRRAMDSSDLAHGGVISLRTTVYAQMEEITELQSADRRRQRAMSELLETDRRRREEMRELRAADRTRQQQIVQTLTAVQTLQREMVPLQGLVATLQGQVTDLQGQVMTLQGQVTTLQGQQGPAGGPAQPELPEEAGSSS